MKPTLYSVIKEMETNIHYKIVGFSNNPEKILAIMIKDEKPLGMPKAFELDYFSDSQKFRQLDFDPYKIDKMEEELTESECKIRNSRLDVIKPLLEDPRIFDPVWRYREIRYICNNQNKLKKTTIFKLLKRGWMYGPDDNSMLPKFENCGGPGKEKKMTDRIIGPTNGVPTIRKALTPNDIERIEKGFRKHYIKNPKNGYRASYIRFLADESFKENEMPTYKQYVYRGEKRNNAYDVLCARAGEIVERKDLRNLKGTARDHVFGPCSEVMFDSTIDNEDLTQLNSPANYFGRPTFYLMVDVYSGMVVGLYLTPEYAAYLPACLAIINMAEDKVEFCKKHNIEITHQDWPCNHVPGRLLADRGELISNLSTSLTKNLGIDISNTPSYRPDLKSYVEKQFHILQAKIKGLLFGNGLVDKNDAKRITKDPKKNAVLNLEDMIYLIILEIIHYNKTHWMANYPMTAEMRAEIKEPTPINIWNYGLSKGLGNLRRIDKHVIWRNCLHRKSASVGKGGIELKPYHLIPKNAEDEKILNQIRFSPSRKCEIAYHPTYFKETYLLHNNNFYPLKPREGIEYDSYFELDDFLKRQEDRKVIHDKETLKSDVETKRMQVKRVEEAVKGRSKKVIMNNAREFREQEIGDHRDRVIPTDNQSLENPEQVKAEDSSKPKSVSALPSYLDILKTLK
jgi:putative transposase